MGHSIALNFEDGDVRRVRCVHDPNSRNLHVVGARVNLCVSNVTEFPGHEIVT
jgi:hypothetical protein